jgi:hypothetical protein
VEILPALYGRLMIPHSVFQELRHPRTPAVMQVWLANPPPWLERCHPTSHADTALAVLDAGERDAILLVQFSAELLLIDEGERYDRGIRFHRAGQLAVHLIGQSRIAQPSAPAIVGADMDIQLSGDTPRRTRETEEKGGQNPVRRLFEE